MHFRMLRDIYYGCAASCSRSGKEWRVFFSVFKALLSALRGSGEYGPTRGRGQWRLLLSIKSNRGPEHRGSMEGHRCLLLSLLLLHPLLIPPHSTIVTITPHMQDFGIVCSHSRHARRSLEPGVNAEKSNSPAYGTYLRLEPHTQPLTT